MLQTLYYIPGEVAGIPVFGFGLLLAVWAVVGAVSLAVLIRRHGFGSEALGYVPILLVVGAIIWQVLPGLLVPIPDRAPLVGMPIRGYGMMMMLAVVSATGLLVWRVGRLGLPADIAVTIAVWTSVPGFIGARVFYVVQKWPLFQAVYDEQGPRALAVELVNVSHGGLVVYGALIGGLGGLLAFLHKQRWPLLAGLDLIVTSMVLGLMLGRIGCLMNGCCYGGACDLPWAVTFPKGSPPYESQAARGQLCGFRLPLQLDDEPVLVDVRPDSPAAPAGLQPGDRLQRIGATEVSTSADAQRLLYRAVDAGKAVHLTLADGRRIALAAIEPAARSRPVHPVQVYAAINAALLCLLLLAYDPFTRHDGQLFAVALTVYPATRFLLEMIRTDELPIGPTGMTISQNVSLVLLVCAAGLWYYLLSRRPGKKRLTLPSAA